MCIEAIVWSSSLSEFYFIVVHDVVEQRSIIRKVAVSNNDFCTWISTRFLQL